MATGDRPHKLPIFESIFEYHMMPFDDRLYLELYGRGRVRGRGLRHGGGPATRCSPPRLAGLEKGKKRLRVSKTATGEEGLVLRKTRVI